MYYTVEGFQKEGPRVRLEANRCLNRGMTTMGIHNCDEAALYLHKSSQKSVVPVQKHPHSVSAATSEHISVNCCVNAAGCAIHPMVIFSGSMPLWALSQERPHTCAIFLFRIGLHEWFKKCFACRPRTTTSPSTRRSVITNKHPLILCAIKNDIIILLGLPPKITHLHQPLDVAVYRMMKLEASKVMSQKSVGGVFKIIYEKSFTMKTIVEGFHKCGVYPLNSNAIDNIIFLRSCEDISAENIDLTKNMD
ncbi:LOW QUALITY PROTEIN: hypothetical protein MAR_008118 [Mya arenaria]|uniref:DDE-1 domain-containing protein n=1 Tax=Mya arenaria TaxID=6604 RepID=A0ABY7DVR4_MYAAR|nr:LOW QUALITY PROTEIN: hypothetical protein MAR_008118 [Mya arenaria]